MAVKHGVIDVKDEMNAKLMAMYSVLYANDLSVSFALDLAEKIRVNGLDKQDVKHELNRVTAEIRRYNLRLKDVIRESMGFFADYNSIRDDDVVRHAENLYWSMNRVLLNTKTEHPDIIAYCETSRVIAELACNLYDAMTRGLSRMVGSVRFLSWMRVTALHGSLLRLQRALSRRYVHDTVELNTKEAHLAADILFKKMIDGRVLDAVQEAEKLQEEYTHGKH